MKNPLNRKPVTDWFGYTRRERRSTFLLLSVIVIVLLVRYAVPEKNIEIENLDQIWSGSGYTGDLRTESAADCLSHEKFTRQTAGRTMKTEMPRLQSRGKQQQKLNLNTCDSASLVKLPGIGPVLSVRILRYRNLLGGYASAEQLREVYGLPEETYNIIRERVFADSSDVKRIRINLAGYRELCRIPYIEKYDVSAILKFRQLKGRINGVGDLVENKLVTAEKAIKVRPYLDFE